CRRFCSRCLEDQMIPGGRANRFLVGHVILAGDARFLAVDAARHPVAERGDLVNVELTRDQKVFVRQAIENGRFTREEDAIQEALALWEERERRRLEILTMVDEAEASLARGEGREITEDSMKALAEQTKERLRRRLAAERSTPSR